MSRRLLLFLPVFLPLCSPADETPGDGRKPWELPPEEEAFQEEPEAPPGYPGREPDHLVPVKKTSEIAYDARLKEEFLLDEFAFLRMSTGGWSELYLGESVLSLHGMPGDRDPAKTEKFHLVCKTADRNLWYSIPEYSIDGLSHPAKIRVITVPLDKPLALRLIRIWERMLGRVAERDWKKFPNSRFDGTIYRFSASGKTGEYYSAPYNHTSTGHFARLGNMLLEYGEGPWRMQGLMLKRVEAQVSKLEEYLDAHPAR